MRDSCHAPRPHRGGAGPVCPQAGVSTGRSVNAAGRYLLVRCLSDARLCGVAEVHGTDGIPAPVALAFWWGSRQLLASVSRALKKDRAAPGRGDDTSRRQEREPARRRCQGATCSSQ